MRAVLAVVLLPVVLAHNASCLLPSTLGKQDGFGDAPTLKLAYQGVSGEVVSLVAGVLLDSIQYPYELVAIRAEDEIELLSQGSVHAMLEFWPIEGGLFSPLLISDANGVVAERGWYLPTFAVAEASAVLGHPFASYMDLRDPAVLALFNASLLVGPPVWGSSYACGPTGLFANLGVNLTCVYTNGEDDLLARIDAAYAAGQPFLSYLWSPLHVHQAYNLTRLELPPAGDFCFEERTCDFPPIIIQKKMWGDVHTFFPPAVTGLLKSFQLSSADVTSLLLAVNVGLSAYDAACQWVVANAALAQSWLRFLSLTAIEPQSAPTDGGITLVLAGEGFGVNAPLAISATVGGTACLSTAWVDNATVTCEVPPGTGVNMDVSLAIGFNTIRLERVFSYEPAVLLGIDTESETSIGLARAVQSGQTVHVTGRNFRASSDMLCRFGSSTCATAPATVLNTRELECVVPTLGDGAQDLWITNDAVRWSNGLTIAATSAELGYGPCGEAAIMDSVQSDAIVWPAGTVPVDFSRARAPPNMTLAVVSRTSNEAALRAALAEALAAVNASPYVLRYTTLSYAFFSSDGIVAADTEEAKAAASATVLASVTAVPNVVAILGASSSGSSISLAHANAGGPRLPQMPITSTSSALSSPTDFPLLARVVPPDTQQATALVALLSALEVTLARAGLVSPDAPSVLLVTEPSSVYASSLTELFVAKLATQSQFLVGATVELARGQTAADITTALSAFVGRPERTVVTVTSIDVQISMLGVVEDLGLHTNHLWVSSDAVAPSAPSVFATLLNTAPSPGTTALSAQLRQHVGSVVGLNTAAVDDAPFLYDCVQVMGLALDAAVRSFRSPDVATLQENGDAVMGYLRAVDLSTRNSSTSFSTFLADSNDPTSFQYVVNQHHLGNASVIGYISPNNVDLDANSVLPPNVARVPYTPPPFVYIGLLTGGPDNVALRISAVEATLAQFPLVNTTVHVVVPANSSAEALIGDVACPTCPNSVVTVPAAVSTLSSGETLAVVDMDGLPTLVAAYSSVTALGNATRFPHFVRVIGSNEDEIGSLVSLMRHYRWDHVGFVVDTSDEYSLDMGAGMAAIDSVSTTFVHVSPNMTDDSIAAALQQFVDAGITIIALPTLANVACQVLHVADAMGLLASDEFVWIAGDAWSSSPDVCGLDLAGTLGVNFGSLSRVSAPYLDFKAALEGVLTRPVNTSRVHIADPALVDAVNAWRAEVSADEVLAGSAALAAGAIADAGAAVLLAVDELIQEQQPIDREELTRSARRLSFFGVTGDITLARDDVSTSVAEVYRNNVKHPSFSILNAVDANASVIVGQHTLYGYVNVTGCPPGTTLSTSSASESVCSDCPADTYKDAFGNSACTSCAAEGDFRMTTNGATAATSFSQCLCPVSLLQEPSPTSAFPCVACPKGGTCPQLGLPLSGVINQAGYWRGSSASPSFDACFLESRCASVGKTTALDPADVESFHTTLTFNESTPCPSGRFGPLCESCLPGFGKSNTGSCTKCTAAGVQAVYASLLLLLVVGFVIVLVTAQLLQRQALVFSKRRANNLKAFISYLQLSQFLNFFGVSWSESMKTLLGFQSMASGGAASFINWDCMLQGSTLDLPPVYLVFVFYMSAPLVLLLVAAGVGCVMHRARSRFWVDAVFATLWTFMFVLFPSLLTTVLRMFDCVELASIPTPVLRADMVISCEDPTYRRFKVAAIVFAVLYIVGIPMVAWVTLFRRRHVLHASAEQRDPDHIVHISTTDLAGLFSQFDVTMQSPAPEWAKPKRRSRRLSTMIVHAVTKHRKSRRVSVSELPAGVELRTLRERVLDLRASFDGIQAWVGDDLRRLEMCQALFVECVQAITSNKDLRPADATHRSLLRFRRILRTQRRYAFLYQGYRPHRAWFEVVSLLRKAAVVCLTVGVSQNGRTQLALAVILLGASLMVSVLLDPFRRLSVVRPVPLYKTEAERSSGREAAVYELSLDVEDLTRPSLSSSLESRLRRLPWYQRLPEYVETTHLERVSLLVIIVNMALCFVGDAAVSIGSTQPLVQPTISAQNIMVLLHVAMMFVFVAVVACDSYSHAKLRVHLLRRVFCCGRGGTKTPAPAPARQPRQSARRASVERPRLATLEMQRLTAEATEVVNPLQVSGRSSPRAGTTRVRVEEA